MDTPGIEPGTFHKVASMKCEAKIIPLDHVPNATIPRRQANVGTDSSEALEEWEVLALATPASGPYGGGEGRRAALWRTHIADFAGDRSAPAGDSAVLERWYGPAAWPRGVSASAVLFPAAEQRPRPQNPFRDLPFYHYFRAQHRDVASRTSGMGSTLEFGYQAGGWSRGGAPLQNLPCFYELGMVDAGETL
ncbi:hypothetical protein B0I37DRAFT_350040 [Chaetomium sp. MPI-CAGE-AT-0009]|nr:hypothetical protein B0I37DRAFT_350040 [Chaetomium sp. MPI-CAGE-AT-0009]